MIRRILGLAVLMLATPAQAADLSTIGCIGDKLDAATREQIATDVAHNLEANKQGGKYSPSVIKAFNEAAAACATENRWPVAAGRPAILYTLAKFSLPTVQRIATERGLDVSALEVQWFALPEEQRNKPLTPELYHQLADAAIPEGEGRTQAMGTLVHTFFEFENILQSASVDFAKAV